MLKISYIAPLKTLVAKQNIWPFQKCTISHLATFFLLLGVLSFHGGGLCVWDTLRARPAGVLTPSRFGIQHVFIFFIMCFFFSRRPVLLLLLYFNSFQTFPCEVFHFCVNNTFYCNHPYFLQCSGLDLNRSQSWHHLIRPHLSRVWPISLFTVQNISRSVCQGD